MKYEFTVSQILKNGENGSKSEVATYNAIGIFKNDKMIYKFTANTLADGLSIDNHHNEKNMQILAQGLGL